MDKTNNLGLNLPQYNETADIVDLNANFEILDAAIKDVDEEKVNKSGDTMTGLLALPAMKLEGDMSNTDPGRLSKCTVTKSIFSTGATSNKVNEAVVDLGLVSESTGGMAGTLFITVVGSINHGIVIGAITKKIEVFLVAKETTPRLQNTKYTEVSDLTKLGISISDIYIENGRAKFKITQNVGHLNTYLVTIDAYGKFLGIENMTVSHFVDGGTFVKPSMVEEVHLLSGFASGWEGGIRLIKNSDGLVHANLFVDNNAGIPLGVTTIFTLPQGFRPKDLGNTSMLLLTNAFSPTGTSIPNFFVNVGVLGNGVIYVYPVTGTVFNASAVNLRYIIFTYYTD